MQIIYLQASRNKKSLVQYPFTGAYEADKDICWIILQFLLDYLASACDSPTCLKPKKCSLLTYFMLTYSVKCWNSMGTLQKICQQSVMTEQCFNCLNTLLESDGSVCNTSLCLLCKKVVLYVVLAKVTRSMLIVHIAHITHIPLQSFVKDIKKRA